MSSFYDYFLQRLTTGGFTTEDALVAFLPLLRQVAECHAADQVAPLEGLDQLRVEGPRIWFENAKRLPPRSNRERIDGLQAELELGAAVVTEEHQVELDREGRAGAARNFRVGDLDQPLKRPVYLPRYVAWEHQVDHHDPLTDVFSLGMILASLACGLDFHEPRQLERFVEHRRNLFQLRPDLHPVLARAIEQMTELGRHERPSDLGQIQAALENFGGQQVEFQLELDRIDGFQSKDLETKHEIVLAKLQQRLFDVSRRNRLLHFRPTMQTVNLTEASVPLSFDYKNIRPEQLLTWNKRFAAEAIRGKPIPLEKYLKFEEAIYLPMVLDRIRSESRKDQAEYGFSQLRLVACFLRWTNVKATPPESYNSPLALLPVELTRKKGVRDTYRIRLLSAEAEINPVIRHQFKQLFEIELPERIDLEQTDLQAFHQYLVSQVQASESAVEIELIDRPRISILHDRARRRLDAYQRRARLAGRGVRSFLDIDYSYDPANYHPLGLKLYSTLVRPPQTRLSALVERQPRPREFAVDPAGGDPGGDASDANEKLATVESAGADVKAKTFFQLRQRVDDNPFHWELDLCAVTLGNFRYRKMSLVRDYAESSGATLDNPAFDAIFSLSPRPQPEPVETPSLARRFHVVPCDPTQTLSIARAETGDSYIIQGPPGTGKSQTITNLIADYVARGKRVLFVCEKRAAIDVVYLRLKQQGLDQLCCLIHDSQQDKKQFVMDLKRTYEEVLRTDVGDQAGRSELTRRLQDEVAPLEAFRATMAGGEATNRVGNTAESSEHEVVERRALLPIVQRAIALRDEDPELSPRELERAPEYVSWQAARETIEQFDVALREVAADGVCANSPLSRLSGRLPAAARPLETIAERTGPTRQAVAAIVERLESAGLLNNLATIRHLKRAAEVCRQLNPLARCDLLSLLREDSQASQQYETARSELRSLERRLEETQQQNSRWRRKLNRRDTEDALLLARRLQAQWWAVLNPSWWRLRSILQRSYDFSAHTVKPGWTDVLSRLSEEHDAERALEQREEDIAESLGIRDLSPHDFFQEVHRVRQFQANQEDPDLTALLDQVVDARDGPRRVQLVIEADLLRERFEESAEDLLEEVDEIPWVQLAEDLRQVERREQDWPAWLDCLTLLERMPRDVSRAIRHLPLRLPQLEFAAAQRAIEAADRADRNVARFDGRDRERIADRLERIYDDWLHANAADLKRRVAERFLENVRICSLPASQLEAEQKAFKRRYQKGRKELEHEFGKKMRYKAIRDLVSGDSGEVVKDLKPVWLMSPLSVSDALPLDQDHFDVVIFDEASQITLEEAVPTIFRATQAIVVGDEMQLPPTDFFSSKRDEEEVLLLEDEGELVEYSLDSDSLLTHSARNLPSTMLGWHYRSRSESLISFSNWSFYHGGLLTVPEEDLPTARREELIVREPTDAERYYPQLRNRAVSFHFLEHGIYEKRRNRAEADYIAHLVRAVLAEQPHYSIGVVAFSEAQQSEIESAMQRLAADDREFAEKLELELDREEDDGQFAGLLVKNLENIQGDERDLIIMSVCYGHDDRGRMRMNFGPINQQGGEKRLNVAFSRAKHRMVLVSSIRHFEITNDYNDGANCLKRYLLYAERVSIGDMDGAQRLLEDIAVSRREPQRRRQPSSPVADQMAQVLETQGYQVDRNVGQSQFRCDLAVRRDGDAAYRLGVRLDSLDYYADADPLEREMMKPKLLRDFGWRLEVVLTKDWYADRDAVVARLVARLEEAEAAVQDAFRQSPDRTSEDQSGEAGLDEPLDEPLPTDKNAMEDLPNDDVPDNDGSA